MDPEITNTNRSVTWEELQTALDGRLVWAVKAYRERTGVGLAESKRIIENAMFLHDQEQGCPSNLKQHKAKLINEFMDQLMKEILILEHVNAPLLRNKPTRNNMIDLNANRTYCKSIVRGHLNLLINDIVSVYDEELKKTTGYDID